MITGIAAPEKVVASENAVAIAAGALIAIADKTSGAVKVWGGGGRAEIFSALAADGLGNFLVGGRQIYAITEDAALAWHVPLPTGGSMTNEWGACSLMSSVKRSMAVAACNDGFVYGLATSENRVGSHILWTNPGVSQPVFSLQPRPGIGDLLTFEANATLGGIQTFRIDAATGMTIPSGAGSATAWTAQAVSTRDAFAATPGFSVLDRCGKVVARADSGGAFQEPIVVGLPDEQVLVGEGASARETLSVFSRTGVRLAGPVRTGTGVAAGADGSFYGFSCTGLRTEAPLPRPPELVAFDSTH